MSLSPSSSTQTTLYLSSHNPRKQKFRRNIQYLQRENNHLKRKIKELHGKLENLDHITLDHYKSLTFKFCPSAEVTNFINVQVSQKIHHPRGQRYSLKYKNACLAMYFTGPKLYRQLKYN